MPKGTAKLLKQQGGKCKHCGLHFKQGDLLEVDHVTPLSQGGKNKQTNKQVRPRHCRTEIVP